MFHCVAIKKQPEDGGDPQIKMQTTTNAANTSQKFKNTQIQDHIIDIYMYTI